MAIKLNENGNIPDYNTDEYLKKFIPLVIKYAPEFNNFSIYDLQNKLKLSKKEKLIFRDLTFKIRQHFVSNGIGEMYGSRQIKLLNKGRDIKNGTEKILGMTINNDFSNSNIGQVNHSSESSNNPQTINISNKENPKKKNNLIIKFLKIISENKLISGLLIIVILYIIKIVFGIELK
ncbi:hypothetical protein H7F37_04200 [Winogradskyella sp. PAMC22761]|nr:hypothetical protein H7F37_03615 [Winogradskyella sp. PAMC22761]QNK78295.1 hypothetical protein H7F37_04200 [Winogradskyella sp. PAMC22761]